MFGRILSLRYLWQSCKQFCVAVCLHQLIKRTLIAVLPHLEHNPSWLHQDPLQLLSNLPTQASSFSAATHCSAALSPNKPFLIMCGCWGFSPGKDGMHAAWLEIVVWVLPGEQGASKSILWLAEVQEYGTGLYSSPARREHSPFPKKHSFLWALCFSIIAIILSKAIGVFQWGKRLVVMTWCLKWDKDLNVFQGNLGYTSFADSMRFVGTIQKHTDDFVQRSCFCLKPRNTWPIASNYFFI